MIGQQLINGLTLGSIYALIALGYTLVYGILLMINFAHSEIFMLGAYTGILGIVYFQKHLIRDNLYLSLILIFTLAFLGAAFLGVIIEKLAYKPLRKALRLSPLISAIGVSIVLQNAVMIGISASSLETPEIFPTKLFKFAGLEISLLQIFIFFTAIFLMVILHLFIKKHILGKAMRATAEDKDAASLMGININFIISLTFFIGAGLGGIAGLLNGIYYGSIKYNMGFLPGIKAFTAAVLGGIGNVQGAMLGGFLLGILESLAAGLIPNGAQWKDVFAFIILILVLIIKPTGILGEKVVEKV